MKKLVPFLIVIWLLIGAGSFFVWWKVTRNLTTEEVTAHANRVAQELEIPWALRFKHIRPSYGADFRVVIEGLEATAKDGTKIFEAKTAEVRFPWMIFFSSNPSRVNVFVDTVNVVDWVRVLGEVESFIDQRKVDRSQQISLPQHLVNSTFNLRLSDLRGPWGAKEFVLSKLFLLNLDPGSPTAFEVVVPWEYSWSGAHLSGESKVLGEYRIARQKADLHYVVKNRLQMQRGNRIRTGEFSFEGKGFFHPRMGLFSTLTAKDDWIAFVGDVEWTSKIFKLNVPKFAVSHLLVLDMLPFTNLHAGAGSYQSSAVNGEFRILRSAEENTTQATIRTKPSAKINFAGLGEKPVSLDMQIRNNEAVEASIKLEGVPVFELSQSRRDSLLKWRPDLFTPNPLSNWYAPHNEVWDLIWPLPWQRLNVTVGEQTPYTLERFQDKLKVSNFVPNPELPAMGLVYPRFMDGDLEWTAQFDSRPLEVLFQQTGRDFPFVPGHAYTGMVHSLSKDNMNLKLAWKGGVLPLLSKSSCKGLMQEKTELKDLFSETLSHQAELKIEGPYFKINRWNAKTNKAQWDFQGEWSNSPIKCQLKITERVARKKAITHTIEMH